MNKTSEGITKNRMSQDMALISLLVLPSYFIKKNTKKDVNGKDLRRAPPIGVFSDSFVTVAIIMAEIRTFIVKYILIFFQRLKFNK